MTNKAEIEALRSFTGLPDDGWEGYEWDTFLVARGRAQQLVDKWDREQDRKVAADEQRAERKRERDEAAGVVPKVRKPVAAQSTKRKDEYRERVAVRHETLSRAGYRCEGPDRGLPGACG